MGKFSGRTKVVISFYDRRTTEHLDRLLRAISQYRSGQEFDTLVVVNSTGETRIDSLIAGRAEVLYRPNIGMNIGAWNAGWRHDPTYDRYVFLQDECLPIRDDWLSMIVTPLDDPSVGLVGESFNLAWELKWDELARSHAGSDLPGHMINGRPAPRVETYLHAMNTWGIDPGTTGQHLRSLVWGLRLDTLKKLGDFPLGANYGECIAAEIGVSRAIAAMGLRLEQVGALPFYCVTHFEWNADTPWLTPTHKRQNQPLSVGRSKTELDQEAKFAWDRAVQMVADQKGDAAIISFLALQLKLLDREKEIANLRKALLKSKH